MTTTKNEKVSGTCQACFGRFAINGEVMVHHGYKRPGDGYIVGDCWGVHKKPYELDVTITTAWHAEVEARIAGLLRRVEEVKVADVVEVVVEHYAGFNKPRRVEVVTFRAGEPVPAEHLSVAYTFEDARARVVRKLEGTIESLRRLAKDLAKRIAAWVYAPEKLVRTERAERKGPTIHAPKPTAPGVGLCTMMMSSRRTMYTNPDPAAVTCSRCKARLEARASRVAAKAGK